jgi:hypothetical protein
MSSPPVDNKNALGVNKAAIPAGRVCRSTHQTASCRTLFMAFSLVDPGHRRARFGSPAPARLRHSAKDRRRNQSGPCAGSRTCPWRHDPRGRRASPDARLRHGHARFSAFHSGCSGCRLEIAPGSGDHCRAVQPVRHEKRPSVATSWIQTGRHRSRQRRIRAPPPERSRRPADGQPSRRVRTIALAQDHALTTIRLYGCHFRSEMLATAPV